MINTLGSYIYEFLKSPWNWFFLRSIFFSKNFFIFKNKFLIFKKNNFIFQKTFSVFENKKIIFLGISLSLFVLSVDSCKVLSQIIIKTIPVELVSVKDSDTIRLRFENDFEFDARLDGIDSPELLQEFGEQCRDELIKLLQDQSLRMWQRSRDSFGRPLIKLLRNNYQDVNLLILKSGCGWFASGRISDKAEYKDAVKTAYKEQLMIWSSPNPCRPRKFRLGLCSTNQGRIKL